ncbi:MAG: hypothetical protein F6K55_47940 [Moorea sp. SIO4A3]|nr:hypothetical protein [Moorena sp. SIO4A3]
MHNYQVNRIVFPVPCSLFPKIQKFVPNLITNRCIVYGDTYLEEFIPNKSTYSPLCDVLPTLP